LSGYSIFNEEKMLYSELKYLDSLQKLIKIDIKIRRNA